MEKKELGGSMKYYGVSGLGQITCKGYLTEMLALEAIQRKLRRFLADTKQKSSSIISTWTIQK